VIIAEDSIMGKQKETFEAWSLGKRKPKVGTTANPSACSPSTVESSKVRKTLNLGKPKGKKSTSVMSSAGVHLEVSPMDRKENNGR